MNTTPVLVIFFNRPKTLSRLLSVIKTVHSSRIFFACDGPRSTHPDDHQLVRLSRELALTAYPNAKYLFHSANLGCQRGVLSAIDWFFSEVSHGIILEDDCIPDVTFFNYAGQSLLQYKDRADIWAINGFQPRRTYGSSSKQVLSKLFFAWGWATWSDRWLSYRANSSLPTARDLEASLKESPSFTTPSIPYYVSALSLLENGSLDTWDFQVFFFVVLSRLYVVKPWINLVSNIGVDGTHSNKADLNHGCCTGSFLSSGSDAKLHYDYSLDRWFLDSRIGSYSSSMSRRLRRLPSILLSLLHRNKIYSDPE